jgi:hypothetical protein
MARSQDFRVDVKLFENLKIRRLRHTLGGDGLLSLIQLWAYAAAFKPDGSLDSMDNQASAIAVGYDGKMCRSRPFLQYVRWKR